MVTNREKYLPDAIRIAEEAMILPDYFVRQIDTENGKWDPEARSPSGAEGMVQLMPQFYGTVDRLNPEANMRAAAATVARYLKRYGSYAQAFAAYNGGPVAMDRWIARYGPEWRRALVEHPESWPFVAGYGTPAKAREVSLYLDRILGPEADSMSNRPPTTWIGSPHYEAGRRGHRVVALVSHIMEGTLAGCDSWFNNPASGVSAHYGIGKDGTIHQYVHDADTAWANGKMNKPDRSIPWLDDAASRGINPNLLTLSVEHEGHTGDEMPEEQYQATLALQRALLAENGLEANSYTIVGHFQIDSVNKGRCPGAGFPWERLLADLTTPVTGIVMETEDTGEVAGDGGGDAPPPDDLTVIFSQAGDAYNVVEVLLAKGIEPAAHSWLRDIQGAMLTIQEAVNRLKQG